MRDSKRPPQRGFTLMELTVVLVIVALLLGGLLVPLGAQRDVEFMRSTEKSLTDIREALIGFAVINGRLPCPAQATIVSGAAGAGLEAVQAAGGPCACTATSVATYSGGSTCGTGSSVADFATGVLPWATLGLLETDAWGNRYTYELSSLFGRANSGQTVFGGSCSPASNPSSAAFALCTAGAITLLTAASGGTTLASGVPALVLSHGANGKGAYNSQGTQLTSASAGTDEGDNSDADATFVSNTTIDDRLVWIGAPQLMNRMMTAGKLP